MYEKEEVRKLLQPKGCTLTKNGFCNMFHNPVYCGKIRVPEWKEEPETIVDAIHEPIVSEELFYLVQQVGKKRKRLTAPIQKRIEDLPLRGNLVCAKCGRNMSGSATRGNGGKYFYYHCRHDCSERFRADKAHEAFDFWLSKISVPTEIAALYLAVMEDTFKVEEGDREKGLAVLEKQRQDKKDTVTKAGIKLVNDELDKGTFNQIKGQLDNEVLEISNRINTLKETESGYMQYCRYGLSLLSDLRRYYHEASLDVKQKLIGLVFPEKLCFENNTYRTIQSNDLLGLLVNTGAAFSRCKKEKASISGSQSSWVSPHGLEPWTR